MKPEVHAANAPASIWHANVAAPSLDEKANVPVVMFVGLLGVAVIVTDGGVVSTVHARAAGECEAPR